MEAFGRPVFWASKGIRRKAMKIVGEFWIINLYLLSTVRGYNSTLLDTGRSNPCPQLFNGIRNTFIVPKTFGVCELSHKESGIEPSCHLGRYERIGKAQGSLHPSTQKDKYQ